MSESDKEKKEHVRRRYAFAYYKIKQFLRQSTDRNNAFMKDNNLSNSDNNLTAVQNMAYKAVLDHCSKMEKDYDENGTQNL
jgi:hypothetical protein